MGRRQEGKIVRPAVWGITLSPSGGESDLEGLTLRACSITLSKCKGYICSDYIIREGAEMREKQGMSEDAPEPSNRRQPPTVRLRPPGSRAAPTSPKAPACPGRVAEKTNVSSVTLYRIETAKTKPQLGRSIALLDAYGVTGSSRVDLMALQKEAKQRGVAARLRRRSSDQYSALHRPGGRGSAGHQL